MTTRRGLPLVALMTALSLGLAACGTGTPTMQRMGSRSPSPSAPLSWPGGMGGRGPMMGGTPQGYHLRSPSCAPPADLPGTVVSVIVADMGMTQMASGIAPYGSHMMLRAQPGTVPAGQVSFVVANAGWRTHELVVLPLPTGQEAGTRAVGADHRVSEAGSLGEASATCREGSGEGIESGAAGWVTLTLPAGDYELVCNLPNHYSSGMYQKFTVG